MTFDPLDFVPLKRGDKGEAVERLQGWLTLWGFTCAVDGDFGPETAAALVRFDEAQGDLAPDDTLSRVEWSRLTAPLVRAMDTLPVRTIAHTLRGKGSDLSIGAAVEIVARQWLAQSVGGGPLRELPGNSGPVVEACTRRLAEENRLPCFCRHTADHHHGLGTACMSAPAQKPCECAAYAPDWRLAWCAGAAVTMLEQACRALGVPMPLKGSLSCDVLAEQAHTAGLLWHEEGILEPDRKVKAGDLFLVRGERTDDWTHCGVVLEVLPVSHRWSVPYPPPTRGGRIYSGGIRTAEGNTNANGSRNGDRLLERVRPLTGLDFICWSRE